MSAPGAPTPAAGAGPDPGAPYAPLVAAELGRLLSLEDREPFSPTYGCFDRTFWAWKFTDFPAARFQEGLYALAHRLVPPEGARGALADAPEDARLAAWLEAGLLYWTRIQYRDGSFDEAYPYERSLAATAFTSFYVGEAFLLARGALGKPAVSAAVAAFARAGRWLEGNDERHGVLSNHLAAAAAALDVIARITGEERFARRSRHFLDRILARQSSEGWYEEYGGADPGYQVHATFFLARLWQSTRDAALLESLRRSIAFVKHFVHPNGTLGGEYGSRNTTFYFPAGLEILAPEIADAADIAAFLRPHVARQSMAGLLAMDAWNYCPMQNSYAFAARHARRLPRRPGALPCEQEGEWHFPDAGLLVRGARGYHAVVGLAKGGTVRVYERALPDAGGEPAAARLALSDCGFWADLGGGRAATSQALERPARVTRDGDTLVVEAAFAAVNQKRMSPPLFVLFRLFSLTLGRMPALAYWMKRQLVQVLVRRRVAMPMALRRRITLEEAGVRIEDELTLTGPLDVRELRRGSRFAAIHMGSSRYFEAQELEPAPDGEDLAPGLRQERRVREERTWPAPGAER